MAHEIVVFFCVTLVTSSLACLEDAVGSTQRPAPGGWFEQDLNSDNGIRDQAAQLAQLALNTNEEGDLTQWKGNIPTVGGDDIQRVFSQVVAGMNYCIEFTVNQGDNGPKVCQTKVYKPLPVFINDGSQSITASYLKCK